MHFTLADLVADITQNGIESGADLVELSVSETVGSGTGREFRFTVKDNGKGMSGEELRLAKDPFVTDGIKHPHRKVGLGIPFLIQTAETSGGGWKMESVKKTADAAKPHGTEICAWFDLENVDTPPVGDIPGMFRTVLIFDKPAEMVIRRIREPLPGETAGRIDYELRKTELAEALGSLEDTQSLILLDQYLRSLEESGDE